MAFTQGTLKFEWSLKSTHNEEKNKNMSFEDHFLNYKADFVFSTHTNKQDN